VRSRRPARSDRAAVGATDGLVKLIASKPHGEILGCHIIGEDASELIGEVAVAKRLEATVEDLISTMHAHPTMHEAMHEAALGIEGRMIHQEANAAVPTAAFCEVALRPSSQLPRHTPRILHPASNLLTFILWLEFLHSGEDGLIACDPFLALYPEACSQKLQLSAVAPAKRRGDLLNGGAIGGIERFGQLLGRPILRSIPGLRVVFLQLPEGLHPRESRIKLP